ncbi:WD40/YVTN/BNR-like repeat-containing protein [Dokdonella fugitiva]|jgi:photosystem II stability/assembly factor-like uncharacterized protein|uniref:Photosynthesis system II assembly factor YCF48-like protein n=1 Tax=Dokdonella fugitiva TaxID=328517 RepID=A0A4R2I3N5_9GAMM|nr:sialidase family protein [Dokdonella fugitiva]MBA8884758.1 photosystem II stability/assembly factor-like uncharacterized protein [Dokdonella fugitiva]TCO37658.1 hypothetical protein EV148_10910 [Dokdonella fugitiva]
MAIAVPVRVLAAAVLAWAVCPILAQTVASKVVAGDGRAVGTSWLVAPVAGTCWATDVDFADARHGLASCAFSAAMSTSDGGLTWTAFPTGLQQSLAFAHATSASEWYLAREGLYRSTDAGASWQELGQLGANGGGVQDAYIDGPQMVALHGGALSRSTDGGVTWRVRFPAQSDVYLEELHFPTATTGYATGGITTEALDQGSVVRTEDGGENWSLLPFTHGHITAVDFRDALHGAAVTIAAEVYVTADGGASWQQAGALPTGTYVNDLAMRDAQRWFAATQTGCIQETRNAGASWTPAYCDPDGREVTALSLRKGGAVAVGNYGLAIFEDTIFNDGFE